MGSSSITNLTLAQRLHERKLENAILTMKIMNKNQLIPFFFLNPLQPYQIKENDCNYRSEI